MAKKKVLIVDDASFMRMMIKNILTPEGYQTLEAEDGEEAIIAYKKSKPDMVVMDIILPGMNGVEAAKEIIKAYPRAKILMVTALGQQEMVVRAIKAGAKDYITKPFQPARLASAVQGILKGEEVAAKAFEKPKKK